MSMRKQLLVLTIGIGLLASWCEPTYCQLNIIERNDNHIIQSAGRSAFCDRHAVWVGHITPVRWTGFLADFGVIISTMIGTFDFGNFWTPGKTTGRLEIGRAHV